MFVLTFYSSVPIFDAREYIKGSKSHRLLHLDDLSDCPRVMNDELPKESFIAVIHTVAPYFQHSETLLNINPLSIVWLY